MYSFTVSLTSALDGGGWSTPHLGRCTTGTDPVPFVWEVGWAIGQFWMGVENLTPPGIQSLDCPFYSKLLYQLCYTEVLIKTQKSKFNF